MAEVNVKIVKICSLCKNPIVDLKNYRNLKHKTCRPFSDIFEDLGVPFSGFVCKFCATKLNHLVKIDLDIKCRLDILKEKRNVLYSELSEMAAVKRKDVYTPEKTVTAKRVLQRNTPTPRKSKLFRPSLTPPALKTTITITEEPKNIGKEQSKKSLHFEDKENEFDAKMTSPAFKTTVIEEPKNIGKLSKKSLQFEDKENEFDAKMTSPAFKTTVIEEPKNIGKLSKDKKDKENEFDAKITVRYGNSYRSRVIKDSNVIGACRTIVNSGSYSAVVKELIKSEGYKKAVIEKVCNLIRSEVITVCKKDETILKYNQELRWKPVYNQLSEIMPISMTILECIVTKNKNLPVDDDKLPKMLTGFSVLLFCRNNRLSIIQYHLGLILDQCGITKEALFLLNDMGVTVSPTAVYRQRKKFIVNQESEVKQIIDEGTFEIFGDNIDIMVGTGSMSLERQRQSWHWFLTLVSQKRVLYEDVIARQLAIVDDRPMRPILSVPCAEWFVNVTEAISIMDNFKFHISTILLKHLTCLNEVQKDNYLFDCISHPYVDLTSKKSAYLNAELIEKSETSTEGMIEILKRIHTMCAGNESLEDKIVFGGDVLTNERAHGAQEAVANNKTFESKLQGIIHRPEGLHREMNFVLGIYQLFYKEMSSGDDGSLKQLRCLLNRRDVSGAKQVTTKYRPHATFIQDVLEGFIVGTFMKEHQIDNMDSTPAGLPVFILMTNEQKYNWLIEQTESIITELDLDISNNCEIVRTNMEQLDCDTVLDECQSVNAKGILPSFLILTLLARDTADAFKMCDGDRCMRNAKLEWLISNVTKHYKYRLWLWRMLAYDIALLNPNQRFEYKWNVCQNLMGGKSKNIPNDNCVEIQVGKIKKELNTQGPNKSFNSAKSVTLTTQVVDRLKQSLMKENKTFKGSRNRPEMDKSVDIKTLATFMRTIDIKTVEFPGIPKFKDPFACLDFKEMHKWINNQKKNANVTMQ